MSVIIDANYTGEFSNNNKNAKIIISFAIKNKIIIVVNKKLLKELAKTKLRELILEWEKSGVLKKVDTSNINIDRNLCKSDDYHILKICIYSRNAMVVFTNDNNLIEDLKNKNIVFVKRKIIKPDTEEKICRNLLIKFGK